MNNNTDRTVFGYRFDQTPWSGIEELIATVQPVNATHYSEIGFVFNNSGSSLTTWIGPDSAAHELSGLMSKSWISFVHDLDLNGHGGKRKLYAQRRYQLTIDSSAKCPKVAQF